MLKVLSRLELFVDGVRRVFHHGDDVTDHLHDHDAQTLIGQKVIEDTNITALQAEVDEAASARSAAAFDAERQRVIAAKESTRVPAAAVFIDSPSAPLTSEQIALANIPVGTGSTTGTGDSGTGPNSSASGDDTGGNTGVAGDPPAALDSAAGNAAAGQRTSGSSRLPKPPKPVDTASAAADATAAPAAAADGNAGTGTGTDQAGTSGTS